MTYYQAVDTDTGHVVREHSQKLCIRDWVRSMNVSEGRNRYMIREARR